MLKIIHLKEIRRFIPWDSVKEMLNNIVHVLVNTIMIHESPKDTKMIPHNIDYIQ